MATPAYGGVHLEFEATLCRPPRARHRSGALRGFGALATEGKAWRCPSARLRTCQLLSWKIRYRVFFFIPNSPTTVP